MDLSNMLKHAFIAGRISAGASSSFHGYAWAEYDPTESAAYARILSALHPASPLGAVMELPEVRALVETMAGLKRIVEEIDGAMNHGTWRDEKGMRLKDTPEWVSAYAALAAIKEPKP